jgi:hypothetical protein
MWEEIPMPADQVDAMRQEDLQNIRDSFAAQVLDEARSKMVLTPADIAILLPASVGAIPEKYAAALQQISPGLVMAQLFLESHFKTTAASGQGAYGLGQMMEQYGAKDVDAMRGLPDGTTWKLVHQAENPAMAQIDATVSYLAKVLTDYTKGDLRGALRRYGPSGVGTGYADIILDAAQGLKQAGVMQSGTIEEMNRRAGPILSEIDRRMKALGGTTRGYRDKFPGAFPVPNP